MFNFFSKSKITNQLSASSSKISSSIFQIFTHKKLDSETIEELEETLIVSDMGSEVAGRIIADLRAKKFEKNIDEAEIKKFLADKISAILKPCQKVLAFDNTHSPQVIIFNGVNGAGKTTTIGKVAANLTNQNKKVLIAACDTFRAGAAEQLEVWAKRSNCEIIKPQKKMKIRQQLLIAPLILLRKMVLTCC